ncbi:hypothetical protein IID21_04190 [Patescibacteria group bacterium]|nr:hypothetical protein [Patescibacteria group bacterium]
MAKEILLYPLPNQEIDPLFAAQLVLLVEDQKQALQDGEFVLKSADGFKKLRDWFKKTEQFHQIYLESSRYLFTPRTDEQIAELRKDFAGSCYQFMSYSYHATKQPEGLVLLSPSRTLALYEKLFPKARKSKHRFGLDSLFGISTPDSLEIQDNGGAPKILRVIEYTLTSNKGYLQKKLLAHEQDVRKFPKLFGDTQLVFVLPLRKSGGFIPPVIRESEAPVIEMPFTHEQFRKFSSSIFERYRPEADYGYPTLNEIQEFIRQRPTVTLRADDRMDG